MTLLASAFVGTVTGTTTCLLGFLPPEADGVTLRAVSVSTSVDLDPDRDDYWVVELGTWSPGNFVVLASVPLQDGVRSSGLRRVLQSGLGVRPGQTAALRALQTGSPPPLEGLSVALEYGSLGQR